MDCGAESCRHDFQQQIAALNPASAALAQRIARAANVRDAWRRALAAGTAADARKTAGEGADAEQVPVRRPDGDVELKDAGEHFEVPPCGACGGGTLKPHVVFFGAGELGLWGCSPGAGSCFQVGGGWAPCQGQQTCPVYS